MKSNAENVSPALYRATKYNLYAKVANQDVAFGIKDISVESLGLAVSGHLMVGMRFTVYVFRGEMPVASSLRVQVVHFEKGYARCQYINLSKSQSMSIQRIVTRQYISGAPLQRRRMYA